MKMQIKTNIMIGGLFRLAWLFPLAPCLMLAHGQEHPVPASVALPLLTRAEQVRQLSADQAERGYPVRLRGVVTYFDSESPDLFVQDSTAGIWVDLGNSTKLSLRAGELVEVKGVSSAGDFAPQVSRPRVRILGEASLPLARTVTFDRMASGGEDSQWVQLEGIVHSARAVEGHLVLDIAVGGGRLRARVPNFHEPASTALMDAKVLLQGACGAVFNNRNQLTGVQLLVPRLAYVKIEERAPADPFTLPTRSIGTLMRFTPSGTSGHRVRVQGTVTFQLPGQSLYIKDETQNLYVQTDQKTSVRPGDRLDVAGFPSPGDYTPMLLDAIFRPLGSGAAPLPQRVTAEQVLDAQGAYDADVIRIEARLQGQEQRSGQKVLVLQSGDTVFEAQIFDLETGKMSADLENGSRLQLTGVCLLEADEYKVPRAFRVLLRSPQDVVVLESLPFWTLARTLWALGIMGIVILVSAGWAFALKRRVHEQTGIILRRLQHEVVIEERYRDLFENANDIVYTHDLAGNLTSLNRAGERSIGYSREEALKMKVDQIVAPECHDLAHQMTERKLALGGTTTYELEIIHKDGRRVPVEVSTRLIYQNGKPVEVQGNGRDITERKRAEGELKKAKEAAEAASRAKSEFLANMSHEIRTPMNGLLGMAELMLDTVVTDEQREYLDTMKGSADSLLAVINDILDFSKIEARKLDLEKIEFDLREAVEEMVAPLAVRAHHKGLELVCSIAPNAPEAVVGDPRRLSQIVVNLVGNAIKFTERGEVVVRAEIESREAGQAILHFAVTDTGIGIPREKQGLIFEAFAQADGSTTRKYGGTGLGLAICSRLVQLMGGRIWVESGAGEGSTFHFTARLDLRDRPSQSAKEELASLEGLRVLVVDDNASSRVALEETLKGWKMKPLAAASADAALAALERTERANERFALLILDSDMPGMDGLAVAERLKQGELEAGAIIMMLPNAGGQRAEVARRRGLGVGAWLTKPIRQAELQKAILAALSTKPAETGPLSAPARDSLREPSPAPLGYRILVAEDNPVNQRLVTQILEKRGNTVGVAANGREALSLSENQTFDLVLMDVQMPEMDGLEATAAIRQKEKVTGAHVPIIAMTAHAMKGDRERCLDAGMDGYVPKPIRLQELFEVIEALAGRPAARNAPPGPRETLNWSAALARLEGDNELLAEMAALFVVECPRMLSVVHEAIARQDAKMLERAAHALKGSVGNFAAPAALDAALTLEMAADGADFEQARLACAILEQALERLTNALAGLGKEVAR